MPGPSPSTPGVQARQVIFPLVLLGLVSTACAPASTPVSPSPAREATAAPASTKPIAKPAAAGPTTSPGASAEAKPKPVAAPFDTAAWETTLAAARQEGRLVLSGPPGAAWRDALVAFGQAYPGIEVEYTGISGIDFWTRFFQERAAGLQHWDVRVGTMSTEVYQARDMGALSPVRPRLVLPEVLDESKWLGGVDGLFSEDLTNQFIAGFFANASASVFVNRDFVAEAEFRSGKALAEPRWRGKIATRDPLSSAGRGHFTILMEAYGEQFLRELLAGQELVVIEDMRQMTESVIRGRHPLALSTLTDWLLPFHEQGLGLNVKPVKDPAGIAAGFGAVQLMDQAAHPNAATVFVNWLLTREAQARLAESLKQNSRRVDVAPGEAETAPDPARLGQYVAYQSEAIQPKRARVGEIAKEVFSG